ncbi:hypothetical protein C4J81_19145 (plasmid) [Deltaproteobacteria bacterium Smac51]|nr:hypothetical protein C4J81_19145 [Deltaproteobacteria bacterium Smac51]
MPWKVNVTKKALKGFEELIANKSTQGEAEALTTFIKRVEGGETPYAAADCKKLSDGSFEIYLGSKNRATFIVDKKNQEITVTQVGGHT